MTLPSFMRICKTWSDHFFLPVVCPFNPSGYFYTPPLSRFLLRFVKILQFLDFFNIFCFFPKHLYLIISELPMIYTPHFQEQNSPSIPSTKPLSSAFSCPLLSSLAYPPPSAVLLSPKVRPATILHNQNQLPVYSQNLSLDRCTPKQKLDPFLPYTQPSLFRVFSQAVCNNL